MPQRKRVPSKIEADILARSARRCCLCFQVDQDFSEKLGQIAHLDHDPANADEDNLVFLCLKHHSVYDSNSSQHKNYTLQELKHARLKLYAKVQSQQAGGSKHAKPRVTITIRLEGKPEDFRDIAEAAQRMLRGLAEDAELTIKFIRSGSIEIAIECSAEGFERLRHNFEIGTLREVYGFPVQDIARIDLNSQEEIRSVIGTESTRLVPRTPAPTEVEQYIVSSEDSSKGFWESLFLPLRTSLISMLAQSYARVLNEHERVDIADDILLRLYTHFDFTRLAAYPINKRKVVFHSYVKHTVSSAVAEALRKNRSLSKDQLAKQAYQIGEPDNSMRDLVSEAVRSLSPEEQALVRYRVIDELTYEQIQKRFEAQGVSISVNGLKMRVSRTLSRLRGIISAGRKSEHITNRPEVEKTVARKPSIEKSSDEPIVPPALQVDRIVQSVVAAFDPAISDVETFLKRFSR
jgi:DNA-directed RNA polymerase specialized sigma24 family protein